MACFKRAVFLLFTLQCINGLRCPVPSARDPLCPRGWTYANDVCDCCYKFSESWDRLRYEKAERKCAQFGGSLVSIHGDSEQSFIHSNIKAPSWVGLNSRRDGQTYEWVDGTPLDYTNWAAGEPSSDSEQCVEMIHLGDNAGKWNDNSCDTELSYACQLDLTKECESLSSFCTPGSQTGGPCQLKGEENEIVGYQVASPMIPIDGPGFRVLLQTNTPGGSSLYSEPFLEIYFEARYISETHLEIKFYPAGDVDRYEVPVPLNLEEGDWTQSLYEVILRDNSAGSPFDFYVRRKDTGNIIFENFGPLIFEDQFLQFTTSLPSERLYGFGENVHETYRHRFSSEHRTFPMFTRDLSPYGGYRNLYGMQPYYQVVEDEVGNTHGVLILNSNAMEYEYALKEDRSPYLTLRSIGGIFDFHILMGPSSIELNQQYTSLVGRPFIPPYWSLGFQLCRWGYQNLDEVKDVVTRTRAAGIPQDIQYVDIDYMDERKDFTLDVVNFGGLPDYVREVKAEGIHFTVILDPELVFDFSENYPAAMRGDQADAFIKWPDQSLVPEDQEPWAKDYMVGWLWPANKTVWPDFFKQSARDWWKQEILRLHDQMEWDAIWIDMNEAVVFGTNDDRPEEDFYPPELPDWSLKCPPNRWDYPPYTTAHVSDDSNRSGTMAEKALCLIAMNVNDTDPNNVTVYRQYDVHSLYGWTQVQPTWEASREATGHRSMVFSRSTYPGVGKQIGHWYGDNYSKWVDLRRSIILMFEWESFGFPYGGSDICGFFDTTNERLCLRWMQVGAFYPFSRNHNSKGNAAQDPAQWPSVAEASRIALGIRYRLLPYLYTLFYEVHAFGTPVIRPLFVNYPSDEYSIDVDDQFMWGSGLMISPIVYEESYNERRIYYPEDIWYDYYTGQAIAGPLYANAYPSDMEIPLHLRGGSILPAQEPALNTMLSRQNPFHLIVAPDARGNAKGNLFWDDGQSQDTYERGEYFLATYELLVGQTLTSTPNDVGGIIGNETIGLVEFYGMVQSPLAVTVDVGTIIEFSYDQARQSLMVTTDIPLNSAFTLTLEYV